MSLDDAIWRRARPLLDAALELSEDERDAFVARVCGGDAALEDAIRRLLAAALDDSPFLPPHDVAGLADLADGSEGVRASQRRIGPYRLLRLIGEGGMGAVWLAGRVDGEFEQQVAIKLVRAGAVGADTIARVRRERQILAWLSHRNIAKLLDGGVSDGVPWLVMEYVDGEAIDAYCDRHALGVAARIRLFIPVCEAVDYAHRNLVVHRDLKPGNILVTAEGAPKLLDFGIARLLDDGGLDLSVTRTRPPPLTPGYASPEQLRGEAVTTASDVYGLGAVLYRLLTGRLPHDVAGLSPSAVERLVCETTPARPGSLRRELDGDLDALLRQALRHEPGRRYASANALVDDLRAHLERRPVRARPDTIAYRLVSFTRRHAIGVAGAAIIALVIVLGGAAAAYQGARAQRRFEDVRTLANALLFDLQDAVRDLPGATSARQLLVSRALTYLDLLREEAPADRALQLELAAAYEQIGEIQGDPHHTNLGDLAGTLSSYGRAFALREAVWEHDTLDRVARHALANSYGHLAVATSWSGNNEEAIRLSRRGITLLEPLLGGVAADSSAGADLGRIEAELGWWLIWANDAGEGLRHLDRGVALLERANRRAVDEPDVALDLWRAWSYQVDGLRFTGRHAEALALLQDVALPHLRALADRHPHHPQVQYALHVCNDFIGAMYSALGDFEAAAPAYGEALAIAEGMVESDPANQKAFEGLARSQGSLGDMLVRSGRIDEAVTSFERAVDVMTSMQTRNPGNIEIANMLGNGRRRLCRLLHESGRASQALPHCLEAEAVLQRVVAANRENAIVRANLGSAYVYSARVYRALATTAPSSDGEQLVEQARIRYLDGLRLLTEVAAGDGVPEIDPDSLAAEVATLDRVR